MPLAPLAVCAGPWSVPHWPHCMVPAWCGAPALTAASPAQHSPAQPSPAQPSPLLSPWAGLSFSQVCAGGK